MSADTVFNANASFNEYFFAKTVDLLNEARLSASKPLITVSQGRRLHGDCLKKLEENGLTMATAKPGAMFDAIDKTFQDVNDGRYVFTNQPQSVRNGSVSLSNEDSAKFRNGLLVDFKQTLGWDFSKEGAAKRAAGVMPQGGYVPVSPYDTRWSHRGTVLNKGSEVLYAPADKLLHMEPVVDGAGNQTGFAPSYSAMQDEAGIDLCSRRQNRDGMFVYSAAGPAFAQDDASGLSRLRPYMSQADYRSVASWMNNVKPSQYMTQTGLEKSVAILQYLQNTGTPYTVAKDRCPGQLKANISNTKASIRLTDSPENEKYLGRVYKDGCSLYLTHVDRKYETTTADTLSCIAYSLGKPVERVGITSHRIIGPEVGTPSFYRAKTTGELKAMTYANTDSNGKATFQTMLGFCENNGVKSRVSIRLGNTHSASHLTFADEPEAETFLRDAVDSAKENFIKAMDLERLAKEAEEHKDENSYVPSYSGNPAIAPIQQDYWEVLVGRKETLYKPDDVHTKELVNLLFSSMGFDEEEDDTLSPDTQLTGDSYEGPPLEKGQAHRRDQVEAMFGQFDNVDGKRFNPMMVSSFMTSPNGVYRNNDNMVAAMRTLGFTGEELLGDDFQNGTIRDKLLRYDEASAQPMSEMESPFMKSMFDAIKSTIQQTGCEVQDSDIKIDKNGVVHYKANQLFGQKAERRPIEGEIGQIFEPDSQGVVETRFNGSENHLFSPGYMAYILPQKEGEHLPLEERTRYRGYQQTMIANLGEQLRYDIMLDGTMKDGVKQVGATTSVNNTYRGLYEARYSVSVERQPGETLKEAYLREAEMTHLPKEVVDARFATNARLVKFSTEVKEGSTIDADYRHTIGARMEDTSLSDLTNDNVISPYELTGRRNMTVMDENGDGYFDKTATGSAKNQGIIRYAAEGAQFTADGRLIPSEDKSDLAPMMKLDCMKYLKHTPFDRQQMVFSNLMSASGVSDRVGMAQLTLCGKTFDDGAVISSDFAEKYAVMGEDGQKRPLVKGDKICDFAGNKCIIADVIDRNMTKEEAEAKNLSTEVELFSKNPQLDVVMAPYSPCSRFNAGSAKALMEIPQDLVLPDGTVHEGCMGFAPVIITDKKVEEKTKIYDDEDVKSGGGRKISSQLAWAFAAKDAPAIMHEAYSGNNSAVSNYREMLITMGLDMSETGTLRTQYEPHEGEDRIVFQLPDMDTIQNTQEKDMAALFGNTIGDKGGFLEVPFPMEMPSGSKLQEVPKEKSAYPDRTMYAFPVMSSYLRSGQEFEDGTSRTHDYTNHYIKVFESAVKYMKAETAGDERGMAESRRDAVMSYESITDSVRARKFEGKHNAMRDDFMAHRMPHSATAIWTPDPGLNLNQVGMSGETMKTLGVKEGERVEIWRDPMLREDGTHYMEVKRDDSLKGVSVNPLIAVMFDGDFDGDSVGVWALKQKAAQQEALDKFSIENTLLNMTERNEDGSYKLFINDTMDVKSAEYLDNKKKEAAVARGEEYSPTLEERRKDLERQFNAVYADKSLSDEERFAANHDLMLELSDWARDTLSHTCGTAILSYKDVQSHGESVLNIVEQKAKGSMSKAGEYFKYFGATYDIDKSGNIRPETLKDTGDTLAVRDDMLHTEFATGVKAFGTALGGTFSQKAMAVCRNSCPGEAIRLTYLATQGALQAKHDAELARQQYEMLQGALKHLWRGHALEQMEVTDEEGNKKTHWKPKREVDPATGWKSYVQMTPQEWVKTFTELHNHKDGMNVPGLFNQEHLEKVAKELCNPKTGKLYDMDSDEAKEALAAPMDRLAYGGDFKLCVELAKQGRNLFEGKNNAMFAPSSVKRNMQAEAEGAEMKALVKDDTMAYTPEKRGKHGAFEVRSESAEETLIRKEAEALYEENFGKKEAQAEAPADNAAKTPVPEPEVVSQEPVSNAAKVPQTNNEVTDVAQRVHETENKMSGSVRDGNGDRRTPDVPDVTGAGHDGQQLGSD